MVSFRNGVQALVALALTSRVVAQGGSSGKLPPIIAKGQYFFYSNNGSQFYIRGVAYQQGIQVDGAPVDPDHEYTDPLADEAACARDFPILKKAGTNTIRVYAVDPSKDHTACLDLLEENGIYVVADLSSPVDSVDRESPSWTTDLFKRYTTVIDELAPYSNVIGFFAGNEVSNNSTFTQASAFVKASVRDSKAYIASKNFGRWIGVGYANNDDADTRDNLASYFNCGPEEESVDFWGYNIYEWCGETTFQESGYAERTKEFKDFSVPVFFAEYGCNTEAGGGAGRIFQETGVLYSSQMNQVFSGGIVYEYFQEANDYGLVNITGTKVVENDGFKALASQIRASGYPTTGTQTQGSYQPTNKPRACPSIAEGKQAWQAVSSPLPPSPNSTVCDCMFESLKCVPSDKVLNNATAVASLFGTVCGLDDTACAGIVHDASTGTYGLYSACSPKQQLAHALDTYYANQKEAKDACDFGGQAKLSTKSTAATTCSSVLESASASASAAGNGGGGGGDDKKNSGMRLGAGDMMVGMYVFAAMALGAAMVIL
ncbi:putative beta (1-3) glucanosyltransferase gel3p [Apodospora peruviana]|uniref:1,3-beta-glucanosyltransferase n=1 Tax=Apodospora peruviana TaxID=516989 RepID=A0AAE0I3Y0_9PEZI|nr:putative beta (1-3) glucanosyltransferase gel3p [Apodospora peruviana]